MHTQRDPYEPRGAEPDDLDAGRALLGAVEWLGEVLDGCVELPPHLRKQTAALASGRSRVPADGERIDFVARVRAAMTPASPAETLRGWLGAALVEWLDRQLLADPVSALGLALRSPLEECIDARNGLRDRHIEAARAFQRWYAVGLDAAEQGVFAAASAVALDEAVDRWCALGCESDLRRYVATWQRSASGWAETALGRRFEMPIDELGGLRAVQIHLRELQSRRAPAGSIPKALSRRLGVSVDEAQRLLKVHEAVTARRDTEGALRRRMPVIRPIAEAAAALERELERAPRVDEIARRAEVHPCLVELALDAVGGA